MVLSRKELIDKASGVFMPSSGCADRYRALGEAMAAEVSARVRAHPRFPSFIGEGKEAMMEDNHVNHVRFIESVFRKFDPVLLVETVVWVFRTYRAHGFSPRYWEVQLPAWMETLREHLEPQCAGEVIPLYRFLLEHTSDFAALSSKNLSAWEKGAPPHGTTAE